MRLSNSQENMILPSSLKSVRIKESLGSQFFNTTTGIPSRPNAVDEMRLGVAFFTIYGVVIMFLRG